MKDYFGNSSRQICRVNGKNKQAEYKYFVSPPDSFSVWSSDLTDLPLKIKKKCKTAPFQLSFPRAMLGSIFQTTSEGDFVFSCSPCLQSPGRQSGAAWHGEPGPWPRTPSPWHSSRTLFPFQRQGWSRENPFVFMMGASGCGSVWQVCCPPDFSGP